jgi:epoxyqueuosine reductase
MMIGCYGYTKDDGLIDCQNCIINLKECFMQNQMLTDLLSPLGGVAHVVSIAHLPYLEQQIHNLRNKHLLEGEFNLEEIAGFNFQPPKETPEARSLILFAYPHYPTRFTFTRKGKERSYLVPPTYLRGLESDLRNIKPISDYLKNNGFFLERALIPKKLAAVCAGLGEYGKNNIVYVKGKGSFVRLGAYFSDLPVEEDYWRDPVCMLRCEGCSTCLNACPTDAIDSDRFLLHAERCITFWNEKPADVEFPDWLKPEMHNCLVGCMHCQFICPENLPYANLVNEGPVFSETETDWLISGKPLEDLPLTLREKLRESGLGDYYDPRNFRVLIERA